MSRRISLPVLLSFVTSLGVFAEIPVPNDNQALTIPFPTPQESLSKMHLPPGFKATVFAAEPDVRNPIAMCWDAKGRMWVAENYTYSDSKERFDMKLRDRILIFEDTDNDGKFDKRTVFADDLQMLTSVERGLGGVWAVCPPNLLFIPDKNNDDIPDGPAQIMLDGFETKADSRHTFANGLKWGPDGWLYGRIGISSTSWINVPGTPKEQRQPTAGGIWRYHPTRKVYEPVAHGTTNPWGMDWDKNGEAFFINTVIGHFWHLIPGAHYKRMHGEDPYPYVYGQIEQHADHYHWDTGKKWSDTRDGAGLTDELGGGHAHVGMMIYQGTNWPKEYRDKVFTLNLHGRRVNVERIEREGSGYVAKHEPDMLKTDDPWFRGVEISYGPDGGVYILDWSDIGECHENDGVHRNSGRIYKITYGDAVKPKEADLTKLSDEELVKLQLSDNEWLVRMARWELRERISKAPVTNNVVSLLNAMISDAAHPANQLRAMWVAQTIGDLPRASSGPGIIPGFATTTNEHLSVWNCKNTVMDMGRAYLKNEFGKNDGRPTGLTQIGSSEKSPRVRLEWASALQYFPARAATELAKGLLSHAEDANDHNLPLMYWFGVKDLPPSELVKLAKDCRIPLVTQFIARRITEDLEKDPASLDTLLKLGVTSPYQADILQGMTDALKGWRKAKKPEAWDALVAAAEKNEALKTPVRDLNVLFGDGRALDEVKRIALDANSSVDARTSALKTLIESKSPDLREVCESVLSVRGLNIIAVRGLSTFDDPAIGEKLAKSYRNFYPAERPSVIDTLVSRPSFAKALLLNIADNKIPRTDITPFQARQIRSFNNEVLTTKLTEVWGELRESSDDKKKLVADLRAKLTPDVLSKADRSNGRILFTGICSSCHMLYGQGNLIGPDLTGSGRHDLGYLLDNITDPSALVAADLRMTVLTLKDGRVLNGIIHGQNDRTVTLKMIGQETTVERSEITSTQQLPISLMPEGLLQAFSPEQVRDLIGYLMSDSQVALPEAK
ncbi:hypothetical protein BH11VER1_BH11VER1_07330 [soil metagenome]